MLLDPPFRFATRPAVHTFEHSDSSMVYFNILGGPGTIEAKSNNFVQEDDVYSKHTDEYSINLQVSQ